MNDLNSILIAIKELASKLIDMADMMLKLESDESILKVLKKKNQTQSVLIEAVKAEIKRR